MINDPNRPKVGTRTFSTEPQKPLPLVRQDLEIKKGPDDPDGSPTFTIYDPVRSQYFKISWAEARIFEILRPGMTLDNLLEAIHRKTTMQVTKDDLKVFFQEAERNRLLVSKRGSEEFDKEAENRNPGIFKWLLYHYLYLRIPVLNPDPFLTRTLTYVKPLFSTAAIWIYLFFTFFGLLLLANHWDEFIHTFSYFYSVWGFFLYAVAIVCVKLIHEFAHAYVAKYYGIYVPNMGVAFIVLWPVLYTDVTDSWRLANRNQRFAISVAGIVAESVVAGICTLGWALTKPGILQSVFFVIASASWISTIVINVNPAMRFDGYYLLCDLWGIDNLQTRAFAITRWQLRKTFLGLDLPPPEEVSQRRKAGMIIYTFYTWTYRIGVYIAIAAFVYFEFTKTLGVILFILEIGVFMVWPIWDEIVQLYLLRSKLTFNRKSIATAGVTILFFSWLILPYPHTLYFPGVFVSSGNESVYTPIEGVIDAIYVKRGDHIKRGQPLIQMHSKNLQINKSIKESEIEVTQKEIQIAGENESTMSSIPGKKAELRAQEAQLNELQALEHQLKVRSAVSGTVYEWDDKLTLNQPVEKNHLLGKIADFKNFRVLFFVPEKDIKGVRLGESTVFELQDVFNHLYGKIIEINPAREEYLEYPQLGSVHKGPIPVVAEKEGRLRFQETYYEVWMSIDPESLEKYSNIRLGEMGNVKVRGPWHSKLMDAIRYAKSVIVRESGF